MKYMSFKEWLAQHDEGYMIPDRPPLKGMSRINPLPVTNAHRKRLHPKPVKLTNPFRPTVRKVIEVVPQRLIPKLGRVSTTAARRPI
jgi:hypothetical protein